jgi:hypothetical protein
VAKKILADSKKKNQTPLLHNPKGFDKIMGSNYKRIFIMPSFDAEKLPWDVLAQTDDTIPWNELDQFAQALEKNPTLLSRLAEVYYDLIRQWEQDELQSFGMVYVPAIVALAGPKLKPDGQREAAHFLIKALCEAGKKGDNLLSEVLFEACISLGPIVLYDALDILEKTTEPDSAWFELIDLTQLAKNADPFLQKRTANLCLGLLEKAIRQELDEDLVTAAAWTLVRLNEPAARPLIEKLLKQTNHPDFEEILSVMNGKESLLYDNEPEPTPIDEWVEDAVMDFQECYEGDEDYEDYDDADIEDSAEFEAELNRIRDLVVRFETSPEVQGLSDILQDDTFFVADHLLTFLWEYEARKVEELDLEGLKAVLVEKFPAMIPADDDFFINVASITPLFLRWLASQDLIRKEDAEQWSSKVGEWQDQILQNAQNVEKWSLGKTCLMKAASAGIDLTDKQAMHNFVKEYVGELTESDELLNLFADDPIADEWEKPQDITPNPKIDANAPCPCGSGKKYKKCCGKKI